MAEFKDRLKELRKSKGISQYELADELGVAQFTVGGWESGKREPNFKMTEKIANFFNVSTDYLLGLSDEREISKQIDIKSISTDELLKELYRSAKE